MATLQFPETIGLVAGWGRFPVLVARALRRQGYKISCVAITGHASTELEDCCDDLRWMGVAKLGGQIRYLRHQGAKRVTMAGKLFKVELLFQGWHWARHLPDWTCIRTMIPHLVTGRLDGRDDSLLNTIVDAYQKRHLKVCAATDFAPELLVEEGTLTGRKPTSMEMRDAWFGWRIAKQMGALDVGQSVTVRDQTVLAVEAVEGTDECIRRTGELCRRGGFTLVKVAKPQQDMRFDVPTIGPLTVETLARAGGRAIVIEADQTILIDREETLAIANRLGIAILALRDTVASLEAAA